LLEAVKSITYFKLRITNVAEEFFNS